MPRWRPSTPAQPGPAGRTSSNLTYHRVCISYLIFSVQCWPRRPRGSSCRSRRPDSSRQLRARQHLPSHGGHPGVILSAVFRAGNEPSRSFRSAWGRPTNTMQTQLTFPHDLCHRPNYMYTFCASMPNGPI